MATLLILLMGQYHEAGAQQHLEMPQTPTTQPPGETIANNIKEQLDSTRNDDRKRRSLPDLLVAVWTFLQITTSQNNTEKRNKTEENTEQDLIQTQNEKLDKILTAIEKLQPEENKTRHIQKRSFLPERYPFPHPKWNPWHEQMKTPRWSRMNITKTNITAIKEYLESLEKEIQNEQNKYDPTTEANDKNNTLTDDRNQQAHKDFRKEKIILVMLAALAAGNLIATAITITIKMFCKRKQQEQPPQYHELQPTSIKTSQTSENTKE